ncbi:MAG: hypothetical protein QOI54_3168 [Actinomycetota bacterium]|nr:hypothetical protein [Actinomycetota bacterium]
MTAARLQCDHGSSRRGAWLGTANLVVDGRSGGAALVALIQVTAIVVGHVLAVVLAHDRAVRLPSSTGYRPC